MARKTKKKDPEEQSASDVTALRERIDRWEAREGERKEFEEKREYSEDLLETLFEYAPDAYYLNDLKGTFLKGNKAAEKMVGYRREELIGKSFLKLRLLPASQIPKAAKILVKNTMGHLSGPDEFTLNRKDGSQIQVEIMSYPIKIKRKRVVLAIARDVTRRKEMARALRESEEKHRAIVENSADIIYSADLEGTISFISPQIGNYGYSQKDILGHNLFEFIHPEDIERVQQDLQRCLATGEESAIEFRILRKDGSYFHVEERDRFLREGNNIVGITGVIRDITRRKQDQEALRESEERFSLAVKGSQDALWDWPDPESDSEWWSASFYRFLGYGEGEIEARYSTIQELLHPEDRERVVRASRDHLEKRLPYDVDYRLRTKSGEYRWFRSRGQALWDSDGKVLRMAGSIRDITRQKRAEEERLLLERQLRQSQKLEALGTLAAGVAHEINNPLQGIISYASLLAEKEKDPELKEFAQGIMEEGSRVKGTVVSLLDFARQDTMEKAPTHMKDILKAALLMTRTALRKDGIVLEEDIPDDLPLVNCHPQQIQQVIINLVANARASLNEKYPGEHGNKKMSIRMRPFRQDGEDWLRTSIEDRGLGISQDIAEKIFDPFFTTRGRAEGTGLGLSVSYGIVKEHQGDIRVESKPGEYARFHIELKADTSGVMEEHEDN